MAEKYEGARNEANKKHGQGTWSAPDGRSYTGDWKEDKFHGKGKYTDPSGARYEFFLSACRPARRGGSR